MYKIFYFFLEQNLELASTYNLRHCAEIMSDQGVYILSAGGYWKIGRALDLDRRIGQLQCGCPERIERYAFWDVAEDGVSPPEMEHQLHKRLSLYHTSGEWFHAPESVIRVAFKEIWVKLSRPDIYARWQRMRAWKRVG